MMHPIELWSSLTTEVTFLAEFCSLMLLIGLVIDIVLRAFILLVVLVLVLVLVLALALALACIVTTDQAATPITILMGFVVMNTAIVIRNYTLRAKPITFDWKHSLKTSSRDGNAIPCLHSHSQGH